MALSKQQLTILHVAKAKLGMDEETYRLVLHKVAEVDSTRDLTPAAFVEVMAFFEELGFKSTSRFRPLGERRGMASDAQLALLRAEWASFTQDQGTDATLGRWLEHKFKVSALRFLDHGTAHRAIGALKRMNRKRTTAAAA